MTATIPRKLLLVFDCCYDCPYWINNSNDMGNEWECKYPKNSTITWNKLGEDPFYNIPFDCMLPKADL